MKTHHREPDNRQLLAILKLLDQQRAMLKVARADEGLLRALHDLSEFIKKLPRERLNEVFPSIDTVKSIGGEVTSAIVSDSEIANWSVERVVQHLGNSNITRSELERVGRLRFALTSGAISNLTSKSSLVEKLLSLANNELGHDSIRRLASSTARSKVEE